MQILSKIKKLKSKIKPIPLKNPFKMLKRVRIPRFIFSKKFLLPSGVLLLILLVYLFWGLPAPWKINSWNYPVSTQIFDRNDKLLYEIYSERNRTPIKLSDLPEYVKWATISSEDKDFYKHHGFSITGITRAAINIVFRQKLQGGSTITQQLVKNALLVQDRTIRRKIREFVLTLVVETLYSKDKILEMYLNNIPYGGTAWGIEAASRTYFGKSAKDLTLSEATLISGLSASPTRYSPFGAHPEFAKGRQEFVLGQMVTNGYLKQEEADQAKNEELKYTPPDSKELKAPHFVLYIKDLLVEKYGEKVVEQGGLRVKTTLDIEIQDFAQDTVATEVAKLKKANVTNGATLVTKPKTGEILAMVGSKDYFAEDISGKYNVTTALRQPGSSIKPINYALGFLNKNITPATILNDTPTCFRVTGQPLYCPENYSNDYRGPVQIRFALGNSLNIPAVKVLDLNTLNEFVNFANKIGLESISDPKKYGLSLTLGGGEVKMTEMAVAFGVFANAGTKKPLTSILKVEDYTGKVLEETKIEEGEKVLSEEVAYLVSHILLDNNARSSVFGSSSYLNISGHPEVSVKTGTTNDKRDNWTIGYTPDFLVVTWVGNNNNTPMNAIASGVSGASPIWNKTMGYILRKNDLDLYLEKNNKKAEELKDFKAPSSQNWPEKPEGVVGATICNFSGLLPPEGGCDSRFEYFLEGTVPTEKENLRRSILINKDNGQPVQPGEDTPPNNEFQDHNVVIDKLGAIFCLDCQPLPPETKASPAIISSYNLVNSDENQDF